MIAVIETGIANSASVVRALERCDADVVLTSGRDEIGRASHLVLPGVGTFGAGMEAIRDLVQTVRGHIDAGKPFLGICLGMQLLCGRSEETADVAGLGIVDAGVRALPGSGRVPHLGWNRVGAIEGVMDDGYAYFANSYCLREAPDRWKASMVTHDASFVAAISRDNVLACQFHPELSGAWGAELLRRWIGRGPC